MRIKDLELHYAETKNSDSYNIALACSDPDEREVVEAEFNDSDEEGTILNLHDCDVTDADITEKIIPFLNQHPEIKKLDLSCGSIHRKGVAALAAAATHLQSLNLSHNYFGGLNYDPMEPAGEHIKALAANPNLKKLYLVSRHLSNEEIITFANSPHLRCLDITDNACMGMKAAKMFAANVRLTSLILRRQYFKLPKLCPDTQLPQFCLVANVFTRDVVNILLTADPVQRANYREEVSSITTAVSSLQALEKLSIFANTQNSSTADQGNACPDPRVERLFQYN